MELCSIRENCGICWSFRLLSRPSKPAGRVLDEQSKVSKPISRLYDQHEFRLGRSEVHMAVLGQEVTIS